MNLLRHGLLVCAASLTGCVASPDVQLPAEIRPLALSPISSSSVTVRPPGLRMHKGRLELMGVVVKVFASETTERTHLDVAFIGVSGETLRAQSVRFSPQRLATVRRAPNRQGSYVVPLDVMPPGTVRIEVRAHDAPDHPA